MYKKFRMSFRFFPLVMVFLSWPISLGFGGEGLHAMSGVTCKRVLERVGAHHGLLQGERSLLGGSLREVVESTFQLIDATGARAGSAVFIGAQGEFVSAAHLISKTGRYWIRRNQVVDGIILPQAFEEVEIEILGHFKDVSLGHVLGLPTPRFLKLRQKFIYQPDERVSACGYPRPPVRLLGAPPPEMKCGSVRFEEFNRTAAIGIGPMRTQEDDGNVLMDLQTGIGMSGGPIFSLVDGRLLGVIVKGLASEPAARRNEMQVSAFQPVDREWVQGWMSGKLAAVSAAASAD